MFIYLLFIGLIGCGATRHDEDSYSSNSVPSKVTIRESLQNTADEFVDLAEDIRDEIVDGYEDAKEIAVDAKNRIVKNVVKPIKDTKVIEFRCTATFKTSNVDWGITAKTVSDIDGFEFNFKAGSKKLIFSLKVDTKKFKFNW